MGRGCSAGAWIARSMPRRAPAAHGTDGKRSRSDTHSGEGSAASGVLGQRSAGSRSRVAQPYTGQNPCRGPDGPAAAPRGGRTANSIRRDQLRHVVPGPRGREPRSEPDESSRARARFCVNRDRLTRTHASSRARSHSRPRLESDGDSEDELDGGAADQVSREMIVAWTSSSTTTVIAAGSIRTQAALLSTRRARPAPPT